MATRSALINVMQKAATAASRGMLRDFGEVENLQVSRKGPADYVSCKLKKLFEKGMSNHDNLAIFESHRDLVIWLGLPDHLELRPGYIHTTWVKMLDADRRGSCQE